jgi:hypothetical protein
MTAATKIEPVMDLSQLPPDLSRMMTALIDEGDRNHVVATAILQAAGNLIAHYVWKHPEQTAADIDAVCDRFVRRLAHVVHAQLEAQAAARLGGGLH